MGRPILVRFLGPLDSELTGDPVTLTRIVSSPNLRAKIARNIKLVVIHEAENKLTSYLPIKILIKNKAITNLVVQTLE